MIDIDGLTNSQELATFERKDVWDMKWDEVKNINKIIEKSIVIQHFL